MTFDTKRDAGTWLSTQRSDLARGLWQAPKRTTKAITFGEYANRWLEQRDLKPRTADHYRTILDKFLLPTFEATPLKDITPDDVRTWHARLNTGRTYRAHAYSLLRTISRTAAADGLIPASPCVIRGAGRVDRAVKIEPATLPELERLVLAMPENLQAMVLLAAWCALRFGELAELRRADVDVKNGVIHVQRAVTWVDSKAIIGPPKSTAGKRDVHVPPHLVPVLKRHLREHAAPDRQGLLFPSPSDGNLTSTKFYESWWVARETAGRPDLRFHDLRHTGAVLAASTGATLAELMARLGHSTPAAAMRYQHAARGRDKEIAAALSKIAQTRRD